MIFFFYLILLLLFNQLDEILFSYLIYIFLIVNLN